MWLLQRLAPVVCLVSLLVASPAAADHGSDAVVLEGTLVVKHSDDFKDDEAQYEYELRRGGSTIDLELPGKNAVRLAGDRVRVEGTLSADRDTLTAEEVVPAGPPAAPSRRRSSGRRAAPCRSTCPARGSRAPSACARAAS